MAYDLDLFVIGGGSGGVRAARIAASHGARVMIAEESRWGGTCVIRGCVPKKLLVYASSVRAALEDAGGYGWTIGDSTVDWPALIASKDREIERLSRIYGDLLGKAGVELIDGRARLVDANTVEVGGRRWTTATILIATGGRPRRPAIPGGELMITSDEAFHLPALPPRVAIIGGGYIGVEFAHIFRGLGAAVTLAHRSERVLHHFDGDLRVHVEESMIGRGIAVRASVEAISVERIGAGGSPAGHRTPKAADAAGGGLRVTLTDGSFLEADAVMAAIGRHPNTADLGLEAAGVNLDAAGAIIVDEWSRSSAPSVYAVGDVTGRVALTPAAILEGQAFADTVFGRRPTPVLHEVIPTAVFAQPPAAGVGLSEELARARGGDVVVFRTVFRPLRHALTGRSERTMMKLVVDATSRRVLGVHMVGDDAPEIIQAAAVAITMGATKDDFDRTLALHPTAAEELVLMRG